MNNPYGVLLRPIISEKSLSMAQESKFQFRVPMTTNKIEIRQAVETIFPKVHVLGVNTMIVKGKMQRRVSGGRRVQGYKSNWKRAIVTLAPGEVLPMFENL